MKINKIISIILSILLLVSIMNFQVSAADKVDDTITYEELCDGVYLVAYRTSNGDIIIEKSDNNTLTLSTRTVEATFHVGLTRRESGKAYLHWDATATQLKYVNGYIYCKNASALNATIYYNDKIVTTYHDGTEGRAYGSSGTFSVPTTKTSFRVGYTGLNIVSIAETYWFGNGSSVVTL